jgi:hypothetical protein
MKIKIVYFVFLTPPAISRRKALRLGGLSGSGGVPLTPEHVRHVLTDQLEQLKALDLYELSSDIYICGVGANDDVESLRRLIKCKYKKIKLINFYEENLFEFSGFKTLYEVAEDDSIILYFHSKGISNTNFTKGGNLTIDSKRAKKVRNALFDYTVKNYETYTEEFRTNPALDIGCLAPSSDGFAWSNFFWIRGGYVSKHLQDPMKPPYHCTGLGQKKFLGDDNYTMGKGKVIYPSQSRFIWEYFIGKEFSSKENPITFSPIFKSGHLNKTENNRIINYWRAHPGETDTTSIKPKIIKGIKAGYAGPVWTKMSDGSLQSEAHPPSGN